MPRSYLPLLFALATVITVVGDAVALEPHVRDGWVLELSYGISNGKATFADGIDLGEFDFPDVSEAETEDGASTHYGLGHMVGKHVALGVGYTGWMYETGEVPTKYRFSFQNIMATATWYPGQPDNALGGFYVRGGVGLAWSAITVVPLSAEEEQGHGTRFLDTGLGLELNVGYEFRVFKVMGAGLGMGFNYQSLNGDYYQKSAFAPLLMNLSWYWN